MNDPSLPLILVPVVVLILPVILVPVGVMDVICGSIASKGIFWDTLTALPPPDFVVMNAGSVVPVVLIPIK